MAFFLEESIIKLVSANPIQKTETTLYTNILLLKNNASAMLVIIISVLYIKIIGCINGNASPIIPLLLKHSTISSRTIE